MHPFLSILPPSRGKRIMSASSPIVNNVERDGPGAAPEGAAPLM